MSGNLDAEASSAMEYLPGAHFHLLTPLYEFLARPMLGGVWRDLAEDVSRAAAKGAAVVDLGCGPGTILRRLARRRTDLALTGVDIDESMLAFSRRRVPNARLLRASIDAVPIEDSSADVVISSMVFHHLPPQVKQGAFRQAMRILRPGGVFLLCDFSVPVNRRGAWIVGLFGKFEAGVVSQRSGELLNITAAESLSAQPRWTRLGCITLYEIQVTQ